MVRGKKANKAKGGKTSQISPKLSNNSTRLKQPGNPASLKRSDSHEHSYYLVEPCSSANGYEIKLKGRGIDIEKAGKAVESIGSVSASMPVVVLAKVGSYSLSIYASGRVMMKRAGSGRITMDEARDLADLLMDALEKGGAIIITADK
jgi:hypothetical protein